MPERKRERENKDGTSRKVRNGRRGKEILITRITTTEKGGRRGGRPLARVAAGGSRGRPALAGRAAERGEV